MTEHRAAKADEVQRCIECGCPCPGDTCEHCYEDLDTDKLGCPTSEDDERAALRSGLAGIAFDL